MHHITNIHEVRLHKCDICDIKFVQLDDLKMHITSVHDKKLKNFQCELCNKSFTEQELLKIHVKYMH